MIVHYGTPRWRPACGNPRRVVKSPVKAAVTCQRCKETLKWANDWFAPRIVWHLLPTGAEVTACGLDPEKPSDFTVGFVNTADGVTCYECQRTRVEV